jgi:hypothetical protein
VANARGLPTSATTGHERTRSGHKDFSRQELKMKTHRFPSITRFSVMLALACTLLAGAAAARNYNFGLTQVWSECAAPGLYNVRLTFKPLPNTTTYAVASGNKCQLRRVACGINGGCGTVTCSGPGPCEVELAQCQQSRGGAWAGIAAAGLSQRARTLAPRRCT